MRETFQKRLMLVPALVACLLFLPMPDAHAARDCYRTYDRGNKLLYEDRQPPYDISDLSSEARRQSRARDEHVVWYPASICRGDEPDAPEFAEGITFEERHRLSVLLFLSRIPDAPLPGGRINPFKEDMSAALMDMWTGGGSASSGSGSARKQPGKDVSVRSYYRSDGTYVQGHTRSRPSK